MTMTNHDQAPPVAASRRGNKAKIAGAAALAAALALSSTFAWTSFSQTATNEFRAEANAGGRLHDDFTFTSANKNKDIYVENFTSEEDGAPIFARVQLKEYLEVGPRAGQAESDGKDVERYPQAASMDDTDAWAVYTPADTSSIYRERFSWEQGGSTIFMPTFNKNKDSLDADINGSYRDEGGPYAAYKEYTEGQATEGSAIYDADDNATDEGAGAIEGVNITTTVETHTAKATGDATVMTMEQWKQDGSQPGPYWVYDTDGWAYWAQAIQPGEATGLLLDKVDTKGTNTDTWYYGIHATGEFVSEGEWKQDAGAYYFDQAATKPLSEDAYNLLTTASDALTTPAWVAELRDAPVYVGGSFDYDGSAVNIGGVSYVKLAEDGDRSLVWAYGASTPSMSFGETSTWRDSAVRTWLNTDYYQSLAPELRSRIVPSPVVTLSESGSDNTTQDHVFLPSSYDLESDKGNAAEASAPTTGGVMIGCGEAAWLRSKSEGDPAKVAYADRGQVRSADPSAKRTLMPLMWVSVA